MEKPPRAPTTRAVPKLVKDTKYLLARKLNYPEIINLCKSDKQYQSICRDQDFWLSIGKRDFPEEFKDAKEGEDHHFRYLDALLESKIEDRKDLDIKEYLPTGIDPEGKLNGIENVLKNKNLFLKRNLEKTEKRYQSELAKAKEEYQKKLDKLEEEHNRDLKNTNEFHKSWIEELEVMKRDLQEEGIPKIGLGNKDGEFYKQQLLDLVPVTEEELLQNYKFQLYYFSTSERNPRYEDFVAEYFFPGPGDIVIWESYIDPGFYFAALVKSEEDNLPTLVRTLKDFQNLNQLNFSDLLYRAFVISKESRDDPEVESLLKYLYISSI